MNNKALTLSLVMAIMAVFFVNSYVTSVEDEQKKKFGTEVRVLKAKRDVKEQETITEPLIEVALIPKRFLEPGAVSFENDDPKTLNDRMKQLIGSVAVVPLKKGEQYTSNKLTEPSVRTGLSPQVAPGRRGVSIPINDVTGAARLVKPGDHVDLIAVMDLGGGKENRIVKTILQDVQILATGKNVTNNAARIVEIDPFSNKEKVKPLSEDASFTTVTLEVDPAQAQTLALLIGAGDNPMFLSLRNSDDTERSQTPATTMADVLGADAARVQRNPAGRR